MLPVRVAHENLNESSDAVIAIRIEPMPVGVEEFDYMIGGRAYVDAGQLTIYGHGIQ